MATRLPLIAATLLLSGCQDYFARRDTIAFHAGEAAAYNKAIHVIDPWPAASARTDIDFNGKRIVNAIERYEAPHAPNGHGAAPSPMMGMPPAVSPTAGR
ncbi:MAG TPA: pilus assembly protein [Beijerinckiaceae bacterium]|nr:pilus assembly protein [Beijerinckiaceae bacterium]